MTISLQWANWKRAHAHEMKHKANFEEKFVDLVLSQIPGLSPEEVIPQYEFVDRRGTKRRIDFMIINPDKGYLLPIELDGYRKTERAATSADWTDFLDRQNSIVTSFRSILRFSNLRMLNSAPEVVREISQALALQTAEKAMNDSRLALVEQLAPKAAQSLPSAPIAPQPPSHQAPAAPAQQFKMPGLWVMVTVLFIGVLAIMTLHPKSGHRGSIQTEGARTAASPAGVPTALPTASEVPPGENGGSSQVDLRKWSGMNEGADDSWTRDSQNWEAEAAGSNSGSTEVSSRDAGKFVGEYRIVCGRVANVRDIGSGVFVNFDDTYPNESMTAVIWRSHAESVGTVEWMTGQFTCIKGTIESYRGKPRIEVVSREQIVR